MKLLFFLLLLLLTVAGIDTVEASDFVSVRGKELYVNDRPLRLFGVNMAWSSYGRDFGNFEGEQSREALFRTLNIVKAHGGNVIRVWLHTEGRFTPAFNHIDDGVVLGPDHEGSIIEDLVLFLQQAKKVGIYVIISLWNFNEEKNFMMLVRDRSALQTYIHNALIPLVKALSGETALAAWEVINEPEHMVTLNSISKFRCHNTSLLPDYPGFTTKKLHANRLQQFVNWIADAIHTADPKALVTVNTYSFKSLMDDSTKSSLFLFSDECLLASGGRPRGYLDFYSFSFHLRNRFHILRQSLRSLLALEKPFIIGEFGPKSVESPEVMYRFARHHNFAGALGWAANCRTDLDDKCYDLCALIEGLANATKTIPPLFGDSCETVMGLYYERGSSFLSDSYARFLVTYHHFPFRLYLTIFVWIFYFLPLFVYSIFSLHRFKQIVGVISQWNLEAPPPIVLPPSEDSWSSPSHLSLDFSSASSQLSASSPSSLSSSTVSPLPFTFLSPSLASSLSSSPATTPRRTTPPPSPTNTPSLSAQSSLPIEKFPFVTIQIPCFNEQTVMERIIHCVSEMDYPHSRFEIQVLDDSCDATTEICQRAIELVNRKKPTLSIHLLHRTNRQGFKAGALSEGMLRASGDYFAIFDADFLPPRDFLRNAMPHFLYADGTPRDDIAFVQTRWTWLNKDDNWMTVAQATALDAHFCMEQFYRWSAGHVMNMNGTAGIWSKEAIYAAGGWNHSTLTEDCDLSYRAFCEGFGCVYVEDIQCPSELIIDMRVLIGQQRRWSKGMLQVARQNLFQTLMCPKISISSKVEAIFHLFGPLTFIFSYFLFLCFPYLAFLRLVTQDQFHTLPGPTEVVLFMFCFLVHITYYFLAYLKSEKGQLTDLLYPRTLVMHLATFLPNYFKFILLFMSIIPSLMQSVWEGMVDRDSGKFKRTKKTGSQASMAVDVNKQKNLKKQSQSSCWDWNFFEICSLIVISFSNFYAFALITVLYFRQLIHWQAVFYFPWLFLLSFSVFSVLWFDLRQKLNIRTIFFQRRTYYVLFLVFLSFSMLNFTLFITNETPDPLLNSKEDCSAFMDSQMDSNVRVIGAGCDKCTLLITDNNRTTVLKVENSNLDRTAIHKRDCIFAGDQRAHIRQELFWLRFLGHRTTTTVESGLAELEHSCASNYERAESYINQLKTKLSHPRSDYEWMCKRYLQDSSYRPAHMLHMGLASGTSVLNRFECKDYSLLLRNVLDMWAFFVDPRFGQLILTDMHADQFMVDDACNVKLVDVDSLYSLRDEDRINSCTKLPALPDCDDPGCSQKIYTCTNDPTAFWDFMSKFFTRWWSVMQLGAVPPIPYRALSLISFLDPRVRDGGTTDDVISEIQHMSPRMLMTTLSVEGTELRYCANIEADGNMGIPIRFLLTGYRPYTDFVAEQMASSSNYLIENLVFCDRKEVQRLSQLLSNGADFGIHIPNLFGTYMDVFSFLSEFGAQMRPPIRIVVALAEPWRLMYNEFLLSGLESRSTNPTTPSTHLFEPLNLARTQNDQIDMHLEWTRLWTSKGVVQNDPFHSLVKKKNLYRGFPHYSHYPRTSDGFVSFTNALFEKYQACIAERSKFDPYLKDDSAVRLCLLSLDFTGLRSVRSLFSRVLELDWTYASDEAFDFFKYEHAFEFRDNFEAICLSDMDDPSEGALKWLETTAGKAFISLTSLSVPSAAVNTLYKLSYTSHCISLNPHKFTN